MIVFPVFVFARNTVDLSWDKWGKRELNKISCSAAV